MPDDQNPNDAEAQPDPYRRPDQPAAPPPAPSQARPPRRPTAWIVLTAALGAAVIGLAVWAVTLKNDRDDVEAQSSVQIASLQQRVADLEQQVAEQQAVGEGLAEEAQARLEAARQRIRRVKSELGATSQALADSLTQLEQLRTDATAALGQAAQSAQAQKARADLAEACLKAVADILERIYASDDPEGALDDAAAELEQLAAVCAPPD